MAYLGRQGAGAPLTSADIPDNSITAAKIVEGTITVGDIGTDAVGTDEIATGAVDTAELAEDAVTGGKLANDIAISTTGNIATTSSGTITSAGIVTAPSLVLTPGSAPATTEGAMYYDSTNDVLKVYDGGAWKTVNFTTNKLANKITATGDGTIVTSGAYKYHTFTASGDFVVSAGSGTIELLLVAGGGAGGIDGGGGGGAGGLIGPVVISVTAQTYAIVIGPGAGASSAYGTQPANGTNSTGFGLTAQGGGGAANVPVSPYQVQQDIPAGGSGGGACWTNNSTNQPLIGGQGTSGQGHIGGGIVGTSGMSWEGAGGGGAGGRGGDINQNKGGAGGAGRPFHEWAAATSTGESGYYAGGGGGANESGSNPGAGGLGGGGQGGSNSLSHANGYSGDVNTGGGGGGADSMTSGAGGSGIAIVRYLV